MAATESGQIDYWRERGHTWVEFNDTFDAMLEPLGDAALARLHPRRGERVLDVGCGCGTTTMQIASLVGPEGHCTGVDISSPMLDLATMRTQVTGVANVDFVLADAGTHGFPPNAYDGVYSRMGTMFFVEPEAAFANLRRALRPGGRLAFVCWRGLEENPWASITRATVAEVVPEQNVDPSAPHAFSLGDHEFVTELLTGAGFVDVELTAHDQPLVIGGGVDQALEFFLRLLPTGYLLVEPDRHALARIKAALRRLLDTHLDVDGVSMGSASWIVTAR